MDEVFWRWNKLGTTAFLRRGPDEVLGVVFQRARDGRFCWHTGKGPSRVNGPAAGFPTPEECSVSLMDALGL